jgi:predicted ribosomally synthesized peptide with SipW-like signal peptide
MGSVSSTSTRNKVLAIAAAGVVLAVGTTVTVAAWNDEEWVFGGNATGDGPGIGTSVFEVQQDTTNPYVQPGTWADFETNPGDALIFTPVDALSLTPGETIYAPVALSTTPASLGGTLVLQDAVAATGITVNDTDGLLWDALVLRVGAIETTPTGEPPACSAAGFASYTSVILANTDPGLDLGTPAEGPTLDPARGNVVHYCFEISLPSGASSDLMGRTVAPAWQFIGTSVEP